MARSRPHPEPQLRRARLEALLDEAATRRLTVVTGGAGTGKTTCCCSGSGESPPSGIPRHPATPRCPFSPVGSWTSCASKYPTSLPSFSSPSKVGVGRRPRRASRTGPTLLAAELSRELEARLTRHLYPGARRHACAEQARGRGASCCRPQPKRTKTFPCDHRLS